MKTDVYLQAALAIADHATEFSCLAIKVATDAYYCFNHKPIPELDLYIQHMLEGGGVSDEPIDYLWNIDDADEARDLRVWMLLMMQAAVDVDAFSEPDQPADIEAGDETVRQTTES
jgi:hypothetical protein